MTRSATARGGRPPRIRPDEVLDVLVARDDDSWTMASVASTSGLVRYMTTPSQAQVVGREASWPAAARASSSESRVKSTGTKRTSRADWESAAARVRLLALPQFYETGELVLVDAETLEVEVVKFGVFEATGGKGKR